MGEQTEITLEQALTLLAVAKLKIEKQELQLSKKEEELCNHKEKIDLQSTIINQQKQKIEETISKLKQAELKVQRIQREMTRLEEELASQLRYRFCAHTEKSSNQPMLFDFEKEGLIPTEEQIDSSVVGEGPFKESIVKSYKRRKCGKKPLAAELPRKEIVHDIDEQDKHCGCGKNLVKIGEDVAERLHIEPAKIYVERHVYPKYACRNCEGSGDEDKPVFRQAPAIKNIIQKSIASPSLLSFVFINKFCNYMPYYRQSAAFARRLISISRADMSNWQNQVYEKLKPLEKMLIQHIKSGKIMHMDETTVKILKYDNREQQKGRQKSYMWLAQGGPRGKPAVLYQYFDSRSSKYIKHFIHGFSGYLQTDEYCGYETALREHNLLYPDKKIIHVACLAHVRRKFHDAYLNGKSKGAEKALNFIRDIYQAENKLQEMSLNDEQLILQRKEKIKPLFENFYAWLIEVQPQVPESLKFGRAIKYAIFAKEHLLNYMECPELYLDNSVAERAIKPFVMGRKNWLFCGSEDGARSSCLLYSLIECAKMNKVNPEDYLCTIFELAADTSGWTDSNWSKLLPWNIKMKNN